MSVPFSFLSDTPGLAIVAISAVGFFGIVPILAVGQHHSASDANEQIADFRDRVISAMESRSAEKYASLFTEHAVVMPVDAPPIRGREQIRTWSQKLFERFEPNIEIESREVTRLGPDWALDRGRYQSVYRSVSNADSMQVDESYLWLLRKGDDDQWKLARIIWNSNVDSASSEPNAN